MSDEEAGEPALETQVFPPIPSDLPDFPAQRVPQGSHPRETGYEEGVLCRGDRPALRPGSCGASAMKGLGQLAQKRPCPLGRRGREGLPGEQPGRCGIVQGGKDVLDEVVGGPGFGRAIGERFEEIADQVLGDSQAERSNQTVTIFEVVEDCGMGDPDVGGDVLKANCLGPTIAKARLGGVEDLGACLGGGAALPTWRRG